MPKTDWSVDDYNNNWFYLWGHTHKNFYCERKKIYADNQIGYKKNILNSSIYQYQKNLIYLKTILMEYTKLLKNNIKIFIME